MQLFRNGHVLFLPNFFELNDWINNCKGQMKSAFLSCSQYTLSVVFKSVLFFMSNIRIYIKYLKKISRKKWERKKSMSNFCLFRLPFHDSASFFTRSFHIFNSFSLLCTFSLLRTNNIHIYSIILTGIINKIYA